MADQSKTNGGTPKHSRFRKSTVAGSVREQFPGTNGVSDGIDISGSGSISSGKPEPVLPMFVQMNVRWDSVDTSWREASR